MVCLITQIFETFIFTSASWPLRTFTRLLDCSLSPVFCSTITGWTLWCRVNVWFTASHINQSLQVYQCHNLSGSKSTSSLQPASFLIFNIIKVVLFIYACIHLFIYISSFHYLRQSFASMASCLGFKNCCKWLWNHRNYIIIVVTPLVFLPLPLVYPEPVSICECLVSSCSTTRICRIRSIVSSLQQFLLFLLIR